MSLGHISYHFPSMDELLAEAYQLASERLRHKGEYLIEGKATPAERLAAFLQAGFTDEFLTPAHLRMRIDLWSVALSHPAIAETELALYQRYRQELERHLNAIAAPGKAAQIRPVSDLIMATLDGLWLDWMRRRDQSAVQNVLTACLNYATAKLS
ncbi:MAG: TetR family transcriptional regulator C-terminal domain-containing protein [Paracoccaceae bacterium]